MLERKVHSFPFRFLKAVFVMMRFASQARSSRCSSFEFVHLWYVCFTVSSPKCALQSPNTSRTLCFGTADIGVTRLL